MNSDPRLLCDGTNDLKPVCKLLCRAVLGDDTTSRILRGVLIRCPKLHSKLDPWGGRIRLDVSPLHSAPWSYRRRTRKGNAAVGGSTTGRHMDQSNVTRQLTTVLACLASSLRCGSCSRRLWPCKMPGGFYTVLDVIRPLCVSCRSSQQLMKS